MNFYYFNGGNHIAEDRISKLDRYGFKGVLFTYEAISRDYFTLIARDIKKSEKIKYMVAIRPYSISPQYLNMISTGIAEIMPNRLQINLISGHIKENELNFGGILGDVNDLSTNIDRSNYLIEYIKELSRLKEKVNKINYPDFFITTTNPYVFETAKKLNQKMIIPYRELKEKKWSNGQDILLNKTEVMIALSPVIRKTKEELEKISQKISSRNTGYFTEEQFNYFIKNLEEKGINYIMLRPHSEEEEKRIIEFVKSFNNIRGV